MPNNDKVAFFDFCETLVDFQTGAGYIDYVRHATGSRRMRLWQFIYDAMRHTGLFKVVNHLVRYRFLLSKYVKLRQLKGLPQPLMETLAERYYREMIVPNLIPPLVERLLQLKREGYSVGLVSAGYGIYLKHFVADYGLDFCYSSNLAFRKGRCLARFDGLDCHRDNKIKILRQYFGAAPSQSVAFSDSKSDLPLLQWASKGVVVSKATHQSWIDGYGFGEIIW